MARHTRCPRYVWIPCKVLDLRKAEASAAGLVVRMQVKQNVQRTLAIELQKLSVAFRKQQKAYLNKLRKSSAASSSFSLLDDVAPSGRGGGEDDYDPGFSEIQVGCRGRVRARLCAQAFSHLKSSPWHVAGAPWPPGWRITLCLPAPKGCQCGILCTGSAGLPVPKEPKGFVRTWG